MQEVAREAIREYVESLNGRRLTLTNDAAYELAMNVAAGQLDAVDDIAATLQRGTNPR